MTRRFSLALLALMALAQPARAQEEPVAQSRIVAVSLFKNGLAVVKREVQIAEPGSYRLDVAPDAVHGTFWIESKAAVEAALRLREVEVDPKQVPEGTMQEIFAGKKVTIQFNGNKLAPVTGTVAKLTKPKAAEDDPTGRYSIARVPAQERFLVVKTAKGTTYVNPAEIAAIEAEDGGKVTHRKPVLVLTVPKDAVKAVVYVSYLAHGLAWAPSYRVDISEPKKLSIEMAAVLRNEMADFSDAEVTLISGYPSVEFANVASPLSAETAWTKFFQQIAQRGSGSDQPILSQAMVSNTISFNATAPSRGPGFNLGAIPEGEGVDLHFEPIGKRSLLDGEALSVALGKANADYERIVDWRVGSAPGHLAHRDPASDEMWDAVHFKNPFKFPLTTAPAMVVENGKFNGQRTCYWTNVGEETNLRITKSLSLRTQCQEEEDKAKKPERVVVGRHDYLLIHLKGELVINNHRKEAVKIHIHYSIRGDVVQSQGNPSITLREGTLTDLNPQRDVFWVVTLQPGEEKKLAYSYSTLVDR
jgi:hypothetical protein